VLGGRIADQIGHLRANSEAARSELAGLRRIFASERSASTPWRAASGVETRQAFYAGAAAQ
jgi:hypothetical protein